GSFDGAPEHGGAAARMHRQHAGAERRRARHRPLDGLGNVVQLQVEEHGPTQLEAQRHRRGPRAHEELEAHLEHPHRVAHSVRAQARCIDVGEVERVDDARFRRRRRERPDHLQTRAKRIAGSAVARFCRTAAARRLRRGGNAAPAVVRLGWRGRALLERGDLVFLGRDLVLQGLGVDTRGERRVVLALEGHTLLFGRVDLRTKLVRARDGRRGLVHRVLDDDAAADRGDEEHDAEPGEQELQVLLALVVSERVQVPLVLLAGVHLGEAGLGLGLGACALDGRVLHGRDLGVALLFFEGAALPLVFFRADARLLFFLPSPELVEPALLFGARALFEFDFLLLLATLRIAQNLLDGDHHRRFLPFRHGALFRVKATDLFARSQTLTSALDHRRRVWRRLRAGVSSAPMATGPTKVDAHITGTVWKIEVKQGEAIAEGQVCFTPEAMTMEMRVEAPEAGGVEQILVKEGQAVSEGDTLLTLAARV